jgi:UDP-2,3-diacylglucosamine hydrolase
MHFGRSSDAQAERACEADLVACLEAYAGAIDHLYLVGDVFDAYIEYEHVVPKGFVRFQGLIARLTDHGIPVTYILGNHDPWHRTYFQDELGVTIVPDGCSADHAGWGVYCAHGDHLAGDAGGWASRLRGLLRHPVCVRLYRALLPGDLGMGLARSVSRAVHGRGPNPDLVRALHHAARKRLQKPRTDLVVLGHSHVSTLTSSTEGVYLNLGTWFANRRYGCLDGDTVRLLQWNGTRGDVIEAIDLSDRCPTSPPGPSPTTDADVRTASADRSHPAASDTS